MRTLAIAFVIAVAAHEAQSAAPSLQSLDIEPGKPTIQEGASLGFVAIGTYSNGTRKNLTRKAKWLSSDGKIVSVTSDGTGKGLLHGTATVTATVDKIAGRTEVTVQPRLISVRIDPSGVTLALGGSYAFTVRGRYSDGRAALITEQASWSIEGDAATIDAGGRATAVHEGVAKVVATVPGGRATADLLIHEGANAALVSVQTDTAPQAPEPAPEPEPVPLPPVLQKVVIEPPVDTLPEQESKKLTAWGRYSDGSVRDITRQAVWSSSDVQVARVYDGTVRGERFGNATIAATLQTYSGAASLTVEPIIARIAIRPHEIVLRHRAKASLRAFATLTDGSVHDITDRATWTSSDDRVAAMRDDVLLGVAPGSATVAIQFEKFRGLAEVTVAPIIESIILRPQFASLNVGQALQLTAIATLSDGTVQDVTSQANWGTDSQAVRVSSSGSVTAMAEGTATVRVRLGSFESGTEIRVSRPPS